MKVGFDEKNCAYGKQDSIVFVDKWVNCLFVCLPQVLYGGGTILAICGFSSDLDQNRAVLWSKSEMKHLKVTIQLCNNMGALSVGMLF